MVKEYGNFTNFSMINFTENNPITNFVPYNCFKKSDMKEGLPVIAYTGLWSYVLPVIRDLQAVINV
jgi:hypothetical protein